MLETAVCLQNLKFYLFAAAAAADVSVTPIGMGISIQFNMSNGQMRLWNGSAAAADLPPSQITYRW